jgi:hypothetical protein
MVELRGLEPVTPCLQSTFMLALPSLARGSFAQVCPWRNLRVVWKWLISPV